jgi:hypothetical protein
MHRGDQGARTDACDDVEYRSSTGAGETGDGTGPECTTCAAPGECKNRERSSRVRGAELLGRGHRRYLRELLIGTQRAKRHGSFRRQSAIDRGFRRAECESGASLEQEQADDAEQDDRRCGFVRQDPADTRAAISIQRRQPSNRT